MNAADFFYKYAGYSYPTGATRAKKESARRAAARKLARAEARAVAEGYRFEWEEDPEGWDNLGDVDPEEITEVLSVVMFDGDGEVVQALGGVQFGRNQVDNRRTARVIEAELALEHFG